MLCVFTRRESFCQKAEAKVWKFTKKQNSSFMFMENANVSFERENFSY